MIRLLLAECKRAVVSKRFAIAVLGYAAALCLSATEFWNDSAVYNFAIAYKTSFYMLCFVCAALPFADSFLQDRKSGVYRCICTRSGMTAFCAAKPIAVFLSGFSAVSLASWIFVGYLLIIFPMNNDFFIAYSGYDALLNDGHYFLYFFVKILLTAWSSAMIAVLCLALSHAIRNTYALLAAPVLIYYVQNEISNYGILPIELQLTRMLYTPIDTVGNMLENIVASLLLWTLIAVIAGLVFSLQARRELKNA